MLKMKSCTPMLLYQSMLLVVLPETDFSFNTPPKTLQQKNPKKPTKPQPRRLLKARNSSKKKNLRPALYVELLRR